MTLRSPDKTFVHTDADLFEVWRNLMGLSGFAQRSLWTIFIEDGGRLSPVIIPIDGIPLEPDALFTSNFGSILEQAVQPPVRSVALLLSRPGPPTMSAGDRRWARAARDAVTPRLLRWPVHLATYGGIRVFSPDDLIAA